MLALLLAPRALRAIAASAVLWVTLGAATAAAADRQLTVMTYNIYQGTEFRHFAALTGTTPSLDVALAATTADYETYLATRFPDRAAQIAAAIANEQPDLVGLQEVATWHRGAFDPSHPFALPGAVNEDFTRELLAALAARGGHYATVSRRDDNFTLAFPVLIPPPPPPVAPTAVGMVESGVILARTDGPPGQLKLSNPMSGEFHAQPPLFPNTLDPAAPFRFTNSWQSIDAKVRGRTVRFITTHLDSLIPGGLVSGPQAQELVAGPAQTALPVIVTGDLNAGPRVTPAAYNTLIAAGLTDTWTAFGLGAPPLTCCHLAPNDLATDPNAAYTDDLDHVLTRGSFSVQDAHLVGDKAPNPAPPNFIWPSDHAGMLVQLTIH